MPELPRGGLRFVARHGRMVDCDYCSGLGYKEVEY
jgi:predicted  nucleic acid-binding Zn-ribbon protein